MVTRQVVKYILLTFLAVVLSAGSSSLLAGKKKRWQKHLAAGVAALEAKKYSVAERELSAALKIAAKKYKRKERGAKTFYYYAQVKIALKQHHKAAKNLQIAYNIRKKKLGLDNPLTVKTLAQLADQRIASGRQQFAEPLLETLLDLQTRKLGATHKRVLATMGKLAGVKADVEKNQQAVKLFKKAIKIAKKTKAKPAFIADLYERYSRLLKEMGDSKGAEYADNRSIEYRALVENENNDALVFTASSVQQKNKSTNEGTAPTVPNRRPDKVVGKTQAPRAIPGPVVNKTTSTGPAAKTGFTPVVTKAAPRQTITRNMTGLNSLGSTDTNGFREPPGFSQFKSKMVGQKQYNLSEVYMHSLCKDGRIRDNLQHCRVYWFRARHMTAERVKPRLTVRVIKYPDGRTARSAHDRLRASANPDTGINYEWNYLVVKGNWMYWLNAGCAYSKSSWDGLVSGFKSDIGVSGDTPAALKCRCGGGCRR